MEIKAALLDVNVLVGLFDTGHIFHNAAHAWLREKMPLAVCPTVINGCVRVLSSLPGYRTHVSVADVARSVAESLIDLRAEFWNEEINLLDDNVFDLRRIAGSKQITDVYLLGVASANGGVLATFDKTIPWRAVRKATADSVFLIQR